MGVRSFLRKRWQNWLDQRLPRVKQTRLTQRNTFIFPAEEGFAYIVVVLLIFIGGINYENALMLGTAFLLGSLFLVTIVSTYLNLAGITLSVARAEPGMVLDRRTNRNNRRYLAWSVRQAQKEGCPAYGIWNNKP